MNKLYLTVAALFVLIIAATGCHKTTQTPASAAVTFKLSKNQVYLDNAFTCTADSTKPATFNWNFGDGSTQSSTVAKISHTYTEAGTYTVTLKVGTSSSVQHIKVYPGQFSYQLTNSLDRDITNYQTRITDVGNTNEYFLNSSVLAKGATTDTIFVSLIDTRAVSQLLVDGTIYSARGNALKFGTGASYTPGQHTVFNILPATLCNVYGTSGTIALPGSAVSFTSAIANY